MFFSKKAFSPPLALSTIATSAKKYFDTEIWDENTMGLVTDAEIDLSRISLVAITGFTIHYGRQVEISRYFRDKGITVVVGGSGVADDPDDYKELFDVIFIGESERTWPAFLEDYINGDYKDLYFEKENVDLAETPKPDWCNLIPTLSTDYILGSVQSSRGCPFSCEFCNIWRRFGRKVRCKPIENVLDEIHQLVDNGVENILFCVDNFAGNIKYAKLLLRELIALNSKLETPRKYHCEISLNIAKDDELLRLLGEANVSYLFIGVESPNKSSLIEMNKVQNLFEDIVEACKRIMSYGLVIEGSMIVGFDNDGPDIFQQQFDFIQAAAIPVIRMHMLKAFPGTSLWDRLNDEGRIYTNQVKEKENIFLYEKVTNIIPKQMSRIDLFENYIVLLEKLYDWDNFLIRLRRFVLNIRFTESLSKDSKQKTTLPDIFIKFINQFEGKIKDEIEDIFLLTLSRVPNKIYEVITIISRHQTEAMNLPSFISMLNNQIDEEKLQQNSLN